MPQKLIDLLQSRKFWSLVAAIVTVAAAFAQAQITEWQAVQAVVAALSAYAVATGIEAAGQGK